jgi:hypothetical protein
MNFYHFRADERETPPVAMRADEPQDRGNEWWEGVFIKINTVSRRKIGNILKAGSSGEVLKSNADVFRCANGFPD